MATPAPKIEPLPKPEEPKDLGNCANCGVTIEEPVKCSQCKAVLCSDACLDIHEGRIFPRKKEVKP